MFDHVIKWKKRSDCPPRRNIEYNKGSLTSPSLRKTHALSRESTQGNRENIPKRKIMENGGKSAPQMDIVEVQPAGRLSQLSKQ